MINIINLKKDYKSTSGVVTNALKNINLKIGNKGLIFIVGKSGSGKSTLLNLLGGLDSVSEGQILVDNKDITKFSEKEYDSYRNTYIGFVFQEFNLLEEYNVRENIELANELQNQKTDVNSFNNILTNLGINELSDRKINELSGGQKQRVAIARALIKNPEVLLCDEPTGNLDVASSEQIFNILKSISLNKLVIVVSHDLENAKKYANRIVQIEDGNIIADYSNLPSDETNLQLNLKKSKLPIRYAFRMILKNYKTKIKKFIMTIILTSIALVFMGFMTNLAMFKESRLVANNLKDNNNLIYSVVYGNFYGDGGFSSYNLKKENLDKIKEITDSIQNISYDLNNGEKGLNFEWSEEGENSINDEMYETTFSNVVEIPYNFIEVEDDRIFDNIIGSKPSKENELVIHKYLADFMIKFGVKDSNNNLYYPKDYQELVNSKKELKMGENNVVISGIMNDDNRVFLKHLNNEKLSDDDNNSLMEYYDLSYRIYVKGFTDTAKLDENPNIIEKTFGYVPAINGLEDKIENIKAIEEPIIVITSNGEEEIESLNKDEVVINIDGLKVIDKNFDSALTKYMNDNKDGTYNELLNEYLKEYFSKKPNLSKVKIWQLLKNSELREEKYLNVIGVSLDNNTYISKSYIDDYKYERKYPNRVYIYDNSISHMIKSFDQMIFNRNDSNLSGDHYVYIVGHELELENVMGLYKFLKVFIFIITCVFILFMFLLFSNFIGLSISSNKKEIGILRAIGASRNDIVKIYGYESIILGIISWLLSLVGFYVLCNFVNKFFGNTDYYTLNVIVLNPITIVIMLVFTICIAIIISSSYINKISKIKPIDVILNKE